MPAGDWLRLPDDRRSKSQQTRDRRRAKRQSERAATRGTDKDLLEEFATRIIDARRNRRRRRPRGGTDREYALFTRLKRAPGGRPILVVNRQYIVRADTDEQRDELARLGAEPVRNLEGRAFVVKGRRPRGMAGRSKEHYVTPFGPVMKAAVGPEPSDGLQTAPVEATAVGPVVAVIDTGIAGTPRSDGWLSGVAVNPDNVDAIDDLPPEGRLDLGAGHGTFGAGIIEQVAPGAEIRAYRALDSDGFGTEEMVAEAMVQAAKDGAAIINLSLGLQTNDDEPPIALEAAVELVRERWPEVLIVAAAGNFGDSRPTWPAAFKGVTAVAGLDRKLKPATWSSRGPWVDCSTIGEAVLSTFVEGTERDDVDPDETPDYYPPNAWAIWTGTSFAAPQIAGAVALRMAQDGLKPHDALARVLEGQPYESNFGRKVQILPPL